MFWCSHSHGCISFFKVFEVSTVFKIKSYVCDIIYYVSTLTELFDSEEHDVVIF